MTRRADVRESTWRHSIETSVLAGVLAVITAAVLPASVPIALTGVACFVLATVVVFTTMVVTGSGVVASYMGAWGVLITGWLTVARLRGVWHEPVLAGIVLPVLVLAPLGAVAVGHARAERERAEQADAKRKNDKELAYWEKLLERLGVPGIKVLDVIENQAGRSVHGRFGKAVDGQVPVTINRLQGVAEQMAVHRRLPADAVHVSRGSTAADFVLHIRERAASEGMVYLPAENTPTTINRPVDIGTRDDGREFDVLLREVAALMVGVRGSGKSNLINVFVAQLARCIDVVIFMIDLKGGRAARPWMTPWIQGFTRRPVIDWLATTREEAELMLNALLLGVQDRARSGAGGEKVTPSADLPAVILICDEVAVMFGHNKKVDGISNYKLSQLGSEYVELGRSEAMDFIGASLRGSVDMMGGTSLKAMCKLRIGLAVTSEADGRSVFPDDASAAATLSKITTPGQGLVMMNREVSPPVHFYRITEDRINAVALETGDKIRPAPDDRLILAMGEAYEQRWTRPHGRRLIEEWQGAANVRRPTGDGDFDNIVAHIEDPEADIDPRRKRMREILMSRGYQGYTPGRLGGRLANEGMSAARETLQRWLKADEELGMVRRSTKSRWVWVRSDEELRGTEDRNGQDHE